MRGVRLKGVYRKEEAASMGRDKGNFVLIKERFNNFDTIQAYIVFQIKSAEVSEALKCRKKIQ